MEFENVPLITWREQVMTLQGGFGRKVRQIIAFKNTHNKALFSLTINSPITIIINYRSITALSMSLQTRISYGKLEQPRISLIGRDLSLLKILVYVNFAHISELLFK